MNDPERPFIPPSNSFPLFRRDELRAVQEILSDKPASVGEISARSGIPTQRLSAILIHMTDLHQAHLTLKRDPTKSRSGLRPYYTRTTR